jgi:hypothetical protein
LRGNIGFVAQEPGIIAAYDGDVEKNDVAVGRFVGRLEALGLLDETMVIVHADHGQNLGENKVVGHGLTLDEPSVRIPLIVRYPRLVRAGVRRNDIVRNIDILPTVLAVTGGDAKDMQGRSLLPSGEDPRGASVAADDQTAFFGTVLTTMVRVPLSIPPYEVVLGPVRRSGVRVPEWKLVKDEIVGPCVHGVTAVRDGLGTWSIPNAQPLEAGTCQELRSTRLHAAVASRVERADVAAQHPDQALTMTAMLDGYAEQRPELSTPLTLSPEAEEKLRSLGYLR